MQQSSSEIDNSVSTSQKFLLFTTIFCVGLCQSISFTISHIVNKRNEYTLSKLAVLSLFIQYVALIHASGNIVFINSIRTEKYYDLTGAITFFTLIIYSIHNRNMTTAVSLRQLIASSCVMIWCIRLGGFLYARSLSENGIDSRFVKLKSNIYSFTTAWTLQSLWVFLCSLPVYILNTTPAVASSTFNQIKLSDIIGLCIWLFGFLFEVIADEQKRRFRIAKHETHKKTDSQKTSTINQTAVNSSGNEFIQTGLWSISRHPNYFGEICVWIGLFVFCTGGYTHWLQYMFGMISPIFVFFLLVFVSGIPLLENANNKRWCQNIEYRKYKESTPVLIPFFGRSGHNSF